MAQTTLKTCDDCTEDNELKEAISSCLLCGKDLCSTHEEFRPFEGIAFGPACRSCLVELKDSKTPPSASQMRRIEEAVLKAKKEIAEILKELLKPKSFLLHGGGGDVEKGGESENDSRE